MKKLSLILLVGVFLGWCTIAPNPPEPYTMFEDLQGTHIFINDEGKYQSSEYTALTFDTNSNEFVIAKIDGDDSTTEQYTYEILSDEGTNGVFKLTSINGEYDGQYMGISILTNRDGSFVKMHIQTSEDYVLENTLELEYYNYVSDSLIHRLYKNYVCKKAYDTEELKNGVIKYFNAYTGYAKNPIEIDGVEYSIDMEQTVLYYPDIEVMTISNNEVTKYFVIEYDSSSTKMRKLELAHTHDISRDNIKNELSKESFTYDFVEKIEYPVAEEILTTMSGEYDACQTKLVDGKYDRIDPAKLNVKFQFYDIEIYYDYDGNAKHIGTASYKDITGSSTITNAGGTIFKYIKYTLPATDKESITVSKDGNIYMDRTMLVVIKADYGGNIKSDSEMFIHFEQKEIYAWFDADYNETADYGGSTTITKNSSSEILKYIDSEYLYANTDYLDKYFNFNDSNEYAIADEILVALSGVVGEKHIAHKTVLADDGKYYSSSSTDFTTYFSTKAEGLYVSLHVYNKIENLTAQNIGGDIGIVKYSYITGADSFTANGDTYKYIRYKLPRTIEISKEYYHYFRSNPQGESYVSTYSLNLPPSSYTPDREMLIVVKADADGSIRSGSEMLIGFSEHCYDYEATALVETARYLYFQHEYRSSYGGYSDRDMNISANIFKYIESEGADASLGEKGLKPYFNFNMPEHNTSTDILTKYKDLLSSTKNITYTNTVNPAEGNGSIKYNNNTLEWNESVLTLNGHVSYDDYGYLYIDGYVGADQTSTFFLKFDVRNIESINENTKMLFIVKGTPYENLGIDKNDVVSETDYNEWLKSSHSDIGWNLNIK